MKVLVIDDYIFKWHDIREALKWNMITNVELEETMDAGLERLVQAKKEHAEYDLLVLDMQFPLEKDGPVCRDAGLKTLAKLKELQIDIPVIICSSDRLQIEDVVGCIWYHPSTDLMWEFGKLLINMQYME